MFFIELSLKRVNDKLDKLNEVKKTLLKFEKELENKKSISEFLSDFIVKNYYNPDAEFLSTINLEILKHIMTKYDEIIEWKTVLYYDNKFEKHITLTDFYNEFMSDVMVNEIKSILYE